MKIKINKKANSKIKNAYKVVVIFMDGDADGYASDELIVKLSELKNNKNLKDFESLLLTIEACNHAYKNGKGGYDGYEHVTGYNKYFGYDEDEEIEETEFRMNHCGGSHGCVSSFDGWEMYYYDELGNEFEVTITFDKEEKEFLKLVSRTVK